MSKRYIGNKRTKQFHDPSQKTNNCQLGEILEQRYFGDPQHAKRAGYDPCHYCLGD